MNEYQKERFAHRIVRSMFNTVGNKRLCVLGFAFKKDTGDTRESAAITLCKYFIQESAHISIYDPKVDPEQIWMDLSEPGVDSGLKQLHQQVSITTSAYDAARNADAILVCTEWDEFKHLDYERIHAEMKKPAFIFDGRLLLNHSKLKQIGFQVEVIGKHVE
jgi:UDPglucose 6-dehydrogenase